MRSRLLFIYDHESGKSSLLSEGDSSECVAGGLHAMGQCLVDALRRMEIPVANIRAGLLELLKEEPPRLLDASPALLNPDDFIGKEGQP